MASEEGGRGGVGDMGEGGSLLDDYDYVDDRDDASGTDASISLHLHDNNDSRVGSDDVDGTNTPPRVVSLLYFCCIAFFLTCGGPFGLEDLIASGGPRATLIGLLVAPVVYALPNAMVTAELSCMMPRNGGIVLWVQRALGDGAGFVNAYNNVLIGIIDSAVYPTLLVAALSHFSAFSFQRWEAYTLCMLLVVGAGAANLLGMRVVSWASSTLCLLVLSPFVLQLFWSAPDILTPSGIEAVAHDWWQSADEGQVNWSAFVATLLWCFGGWEDLGTFGGEIRNPGRTYPIGCAITLIINALTFFLPLTIGLYYLPSWKDWHDGSFVSIAASIGPHFGVLVLLSSVLSNAALYNLSVTANARVLAAMSTGDGKEKKLFSIFGVHLDKTNAPVVSVLFLSLTTAMLCLPLNFSLLTQCEAVLAVVAHMFQFVSFLVLRHREPDAHRPYSVPGGLIVAYVVALPPIAVCGFMLYMLDWRTVLAGVAINVLVVLAYVVRSAWLSWNSVGEEGSGQGGGDDTLLSRVPISSGDDDEPYGYPN
eukprot:TRINITY_DN5183_c0_g2_i1.p1 TRINITY_DN5183_c0_g2~~TRINITY_DN5183_c0_g2_i1.p1  ORF type:complete len:536 (+),score=83.09 TRINITY_DN5183_c0_g2_i1:248-1855(+)